MYCYQAEGESNIAMGQKDESNIATGQKDEHLLLPGRRMITYCYGAEAESSMATRQKENHLWLQGKSYHRGTTTNVWKRIPLRFIYSHD